MQPAPTTSASLMTLRTLETSRTSMLTPPRASGSSPRPATRSEMALSPPPRSMASLIRGLRFSTCPPPSSKPTTQRFLGPQTASRPVDMSSPAALRHLPSLSALAPRGSPFLGTTSTLVRSPLAAPHASAESSRLQTSVSTSLGMLHSRLLLLCLTERPHPDWDGPPNRPRYEARGFNCESQGFSCSSIRFG